MNDEFDSSEFTDALRELFLLAGALICLVPVVLVVVGYLVYRFVRNRRAKAGESGIDDLF